MRFTQSIHAVLIQKFATFHGRASRSEYWWFQAFYWPSILIYFIIFSPILLSRELAAEIDWGMFGELITSLSIIWAGLLIGMFIPLTALQVRRFHDCNLSAWWFVAAFLIGYIPYLGFLSIGAVLVISALKGTDGSNKYGTETAQIRQ